MAAPPAKTSVNERKTNKMRSCQRSIFAGAAAEKASRERGAGKQNSSRETLRVVSAELSVDLARGKCSFRVLFPENGAKLG